MSSTSFRFNDRDKIRAAAVAHTLHMDETYPALILDSINGTKIYQDKVNIDRNIYPAFNDKPEIQMQTMDSVSSIISQSSQYPYHRIAVLNFASYTNPGGGYLKGARAQEESLCESSNLYNILREFDESYYKWNRKHVNSSLYLNCGLYTPDVLFQYANNAVFVNVITVAAPNKRAALQHDRIDSHDNLAALKSRIDFVIDIAEDNGVDILILGAFGCGVFGQDPNEVANLFKERCSKPSNVWQYIFAIPPDAINYPTFKRILS